MKIAFFNSTKFWGGGEKWHYETALSFAEMGYEVYLFGNPKGKIFEKIKTHPEIHFIPVNLSNRSFLNPFKIYRLTKIFKREKIDLVIINHPGDLKIAANAAHKAGVKRVIYRRGSAVAVKDRFLNRYIFKHWVSDILANSQATKKTILENNPKLFPAEKIKVIYNYLDIPEFLNREAKQEFQRENNEIIIGNLGRLSFQKNQKFLIDLSKRLSEENIPHKIFIGGTGELKQELKQYNKDQKAEKNVIFTGFETQVKNFLTNIDIFFLPSIWEGFGYVLAEASLAQRPIIAFNISSNPELVVHNETGFLIEKNDLDDAVAKIKLLRDEELRMKLGKNGLQYVQQNFGKKQIQEQLRSYISEG